MKGLSVEEKARRYDESLERAKSKIKNDKDHVLYEDDIIELFPELAESEDEMIRKEIIAHIKWCEDSGYCAKEEMTRWITFLEKQGEQNTVVIIPKFKVGDTIRPKGSLAEYTIESISGECYHGKGWGLHISCDNDYELVEQNTAWSEEDDYTLLDTINILRSCGRCSTDRKLWLLSLKKRVQPQPKQEWSEEDDEHLERILKELGNQRQRPLNSPYLDKIESDYNWLKSLRPKPHSRPSDEQMEALKYSTYCPNKQMSKVLFELYQDLKKLRED